MKRVCLLDDIRGMTLFSMILYHTVWDLVYIWGMDWSWYYTKFAYIWQQSICWTFIFLSGFCWSLGKHKLRRGLIVVGAGALVSLVTEIAMPNQRIRFGVLTLIGTSMLLTIITEKILKRVPALIGFACSLLLFLLIRNVNVGYIGFENWNLYQLPEAWYHGGDIATFMGFTDLSFFSSDYFSVLPWYFLFVAGYFAYQLAKRYGILEKIAKKRSVGKIWNFMGRQSLIIYMLHQPIIYLVLSLVMRR